MKNFTFLLVFLISFSGFAQWTDDYDTNTAVAEGPTGDIQSIGTSDGQTYVIFWDQTNGYELRVQLLDADGNQLFGADGMLANDLAENSTYTVTRDQAVDEDNNLYIGFSATGDGDGYV